MAWSDHSSLIGCAFVKPWGARYEFAAHRRAVSLQNASERRSCELASLVGIEDFGLTHPLLKHPPGPATLGQDEGVAGANAKGLQRCPHPGRMR